MTDAAKLNRMVAAQLNKTKMCALFIRGACVDAECRFAHSHKERRQPPDLRKTAICRAFARGACNANSCRFAHGEEELRTTPTVYKTQLCNFFEKGYCKKGDTCRHAHGRVELRPCEVSQSDVSTAPNSRDSPPSTPPRPAVPRATPAPVGRQDVPASGVAAAKEKRGGSGNQGGIQQSKTKTKTVHTSSRMPLKMTEEKLDNPAASDAPSPPWPVQPGPLAMGSAAMAAERKGYGTMPKPPVLEIPILQSQEKEPLPPSNLEPMKVGLPVRSSSLNFPSIDDDSIRAAEAEKQRSLQVAAWVAAETARRHSAAAKAASAAATRLGLASVASTTTDTSLDLGGLVPTLRSMLDSYEQSLKALSAYDVQGFAPFDGLRPYQLAEYSAF